MRQQKKQHAFGDLEKITQNASKTSITLSYLNVLYVIQFMPTSNSFFLLVFLHFFSFNRYVLGFLFEM